PTGYGPCIKGEACAPDQQGIVNSSSAAISSGAITAKTAMEDVAAKVGASLSAVQGALAANAPQFRAALGLSNGDGNNQGSTPSNTNPTSESGPPQNAQNSSTGGGSRDAQKGAT